MTEQRVKVYGADWCPLTTRALKHLERLRIPYDYVNVDQDPRGSEWVKQQNGGKEKKPTIQVGDKVLTEPSNDELTDALAAVGLK